MITSDHGGDGMIIWSLPFWEDAGGTRCTRSCWWSSSIVFFTTKDLFGDLWEPWAAEILGEFGWLWILWIGSLFWIGDVYFCLRNEMGPQPYHPGFFRRIKAFLGPWCQWNWGSTLSLAKGASSIRCRISGTLRYKQPQRVACDGLNRRKKQLLRKWDPQYPENVHVPRVRDGQRIFSISSEVIFRTFGHFQGVSGNIDRMWFGQKISGDITGLVISLYLEKLLTLKLGGWGNYVNEYTPEI